MCDLLFITNKNSEFPDGASDPMWFSIFSDFGNLKWIHHNRISRLSSKYCLNYVRHHDIYIS